MPSQNQQPVKISLTLPTHAYFMSGVRDFTLNLIKNITNFNELWAYRFQSIVDELCNNAIEFGSAPGKDIKLTFIYDGKSLDIIVEDTGTGKNKTTAAELKKLVEERKKPTYVNKEIRGRGLSKIVANWTDELIFEDIEGGGIRVIARKNIDQLPHENTLDITVQANPKTIILQ